MIGLAGVNYNHRSFIHFGTGGGEGAELAASRANPSFGKAGAAAGGGGRPWKARVIVRFSSLICNGPA